MEGWESWPDDARFLKKTLSSFAAGPIPWEQLDGDQAARSLDRGHAPHGMSAAADNFENLVASDLHGDLFLRPAVSVCLIMRKDMFY